MFTDQRLESLRRLNILDTDPEERFDSITRIAAGAFDCPMAAIGFVDADRVWFKSSVGMSRKEAPLNSTFCELVASSGQPLTIQDAWADHRFRSLAAAQVNPPIRFYAGYPIFAPDGSCVGQLCVSDQVPHELRSGQISMLEDLAAMVELQLQDRLRLSALQMLTEIEQRYRALIDSNPDAVYTIDTSGCFSSCNDATLKMTGYSREQFIGMPFVEIIAGEHKERVQAHFQSCLGGEAQFLRARILRGDGGSFHASISASVYSIEGQLHGVAGITRDVTPQVVAEQRLRESEARLNLALASSRMGVWECELATGILYQSPQLRVILGYPEEESRESIEEWHGRVHPDDREQAIALSRRLADQQDTRYAMEKRLRCQDGSYRWMQCHGQVTSWDTQGKPKIVVGTAADIHEQKLAEQARIRDAERMALAVQAGGVGIFEVSLNERTVHWDARMHRLFGFKRQGSGPPTEAILAAIHPDD